jgi:hypothetical protein
MTKFNPFEYIFILEGFLNDKTLYDEGKLILIMDFIKANKNQGDRISLIDKEMKNIGNPDEGASVPPPNPTPPSSDIIERINDTISFLKKMCTPENMMEIFMKIIYLIEKP